MDMSIIVSQVEKARIGQPIEFRLSKSVDGKRSASLLLRLTERGVFEGAKPSTVADLRYATAYGVDVIQVFVLIKETLVKMPGGIERGILSVSLGKYEAPELVLKYDTRWRLVLTGNLYLARRLAELGFAYIEVNPAQKSCSIEVRGNQAEVLEYSLEVAEKLGLELQLPV